MLPLLSILVFWYFDIFFSNYSHFQKVNVPSVRISTFHTSVLFIIFFSVSEPQDDISDNVLIENQLFIKTNQLTDS